jgi:hypothetical protein
MPDETSQETHMTMPKYGQRTPASLLVMALVLLAATPGFADESRAEVYTQAGLSTASLTGTLGRYTSGSIGFVAAQGVLFGAFGFEVSLESEFFLTNQPPPPYTRGLQTFTLALGPRAAWHIAPVVVLGGVEYASIGVASNALVRWTGEIRQTHAIGGHLAARWDLAPPLFVEVRGRWSTWLGVDVPASAFGGVISIGISGVLPERGSRR